MRALFCFFLCFQVWVNGQSLSGTSGLFNVPSANILKDGEAFIGASLYHRGFYELYGTGDEFHGLPTYITLGLFNKVEFMFRYTHQLGQVVSPETQYFPDRMFAVRLNILEESTVRPSVTFGLHDVSEALGGTTAPPWFLASYFVASKSFDLGSLNLHTSLGHSIPIPNGSVDQSFPGLFGGLELFHSSFSFLSFISEFDGNQLNMAFKAKLLNRFNFTIGVLGMEGISGNLSFNFNLVSP
jgi:hypothetical protein